MKIQDMESDWQLPNLAELPPQPPPQKPGLHRHHQEPKPGRQGQPTGAPWDASREARSAFGNAGGQMGRLSYQEPSPAGFDPLGGLSWTSGPACLLRAGEEPPPPSSTDTQLGLTTQLKSLHQLKTTPLI